MGGATRSFKAENRVTITEAVLNESVLAGRIHGSHVWNPCSVCGCPTADHLVRRGEIICLEHALSCSKELGAAMREGRVIC